ncbi:MAG: LptF/LptG family permease [Crocinitomicaceae bacterium]|nr:LptF/LptG family permease [Crocinitomicaceae bacterium]
MCHASLKNTFTGSQRRLNEALNKLSILLLRSYIGPFIITFLVAMFIFEMQFVWVYLDDLMGRGLELMVIIKLLVYASARIVNMALPLAILMSSIMTMGALSENNELTAMKSAGVPLFNIMRPLIIFHIVLSIGAFLFANNVWPIANLKFRTLLYSIVQHKPALNLTDGVFYNGIEGISIRVQSKSKQTNELNDVLIYDHRDSRRGNRTVIRARRGVMEQTDDKGFLIMTLYDGYSYDEQDELGKRKEKIFPFISNHFESTVLRLDLSSLAFKDNNEDIFRNSYEMMTIRQIDHAVDSMRLRIDSVKLQIAASSIRMLHLPDSNHTVAQSGNPEWFFDQLSAGDQLKAVTAARESGRRSKDSIDKIEEEALTRERFLSRHLIEWHRKFILSAACLVLFFIGAPLGAIIRKGGLGFPTVIALLLFIIYQLLTTAGERMAKTMIIEPALGMWLSTAFMLPLSIWLTYKATKEAALVERDTYIAALNRVLVFLKLRPGK